MNSIALDISIILPAFLAGILVLLTHIPLGAEVLKRGIVFIDLAIAQIAALGVIIASWLELDPQGWGVQLAAGVAAGMIPLALGTQTGGSVIRPGSFCGIHALKPRLQRVVSRHEHRSLTGRPIVAWWKSCYL